MLIAQEAQIEKKNKEEKSLESKEEGVKSGKDSFQIYRPTPEDYRYWKEGQNTQRFDTTLSINTYYNQNYLRKDHFGLFSFPNIGQTFNPLTYRPQISLIPDMGFSAKRHNYLLSEEVPYFDVKTPTTQFFYESGMFRGQMLQTLFTQSPNKQFNYAFQYKALHSRGRYARQVSFNNFFFVTTNYHTCDESYKLWAHYIRQDVDNEENGGILEVGNKTFKDLTQDIPVRLNFSDSRFGGQRWYLGQSVGLVSKTTLILTHRLQYETKRYLYQESQAENIFGRAYPNKPRKDETHYTHLKNNFNLGFYLNKKIWLEGVMAYDKVGYKLPGERQINDELNIPERVQEDILSVMGKMRYRYDEWGLIKADGQFTFGKRFKNAFILNAEAKTSLFQDFKLGGKFCLSATSPAFNMIVHRSFYTDYNYYNPNFDNIKNRSLHLYLLWDKYTNLYFNLYNIDNYTYFESNGKSQQYPKSLNLFDVRIQTVLIFRKMKWENTLQYQDVVSGKEKLPLPSLILRSSLYYENRFFENNLLLQTGITLNYFSKFKSREFFPVLNEFSLSPLQKNTLPESIGGYPFLDYFFNFEIYRVKTYLRVQHFNKSFTSNNYFLAPGHPATGMIIRLGILWDLFT